MNRGRHRTKQKGTIKLGATQHQPEDIRSLEDRAVLGNSNTKKVEHVLETATLYSYIQ